MMLDNPKQIKAFKILNASGLVTPDSVTYSLKAASEAKGIADMLIESCDDMILYPDPVTQYISEITRIADAMGHISNEAQRYSDSIAPHTNPSELLQMKLGWDCHVKGNQIEPAPAFSLVEAIEDGASAISVFEALQAVDTAPVIAAMTAINAILAGGQVLVVPDEEIKALGAAVADLSSASIVVEAASGDLSLQATDIKASTDISKRALKDAVDVTLTNNLIDDSLMSGAIAQIMPAGVISALKEEGE